MEQPHSLVTAVAELESGVETTDFMLETQREVEKISCAFAELESGIETTYFGTDSFEPKKYYTAIAELESGIETLMLDNPPEPDDFWFEWWIAKKWQDWQKNPAIHHYIHPGDDIFPPDPDVFPDGDFLRLYFLFPNNSVRYFTLLNPKDNLTVEEIKTVGNSAGHLLTNKAGYVSSTMFKALLVKKERWKIL